MFVPVRARARCALAFVCSATNVEQVLPERVCQRYTYIREVFERSFCPLKCLQVLASIKCPSVKSPSPAHMLCVSQVTLRTYNTDIYTHTHKDAERRDMFACAHTGGYGHVEATSALCVCARTHTHMHACCSPNYTCNATHTQCGALRQKRSTRPTSQHTHTGWKSRLS